MVNLADSVGGVIESAWCAGADPYDAAGVILSLVADEVRAHCTPPGEAYALGGDSLITAVADWIHRPARENGGG